VDCRTFFLSSSLFLSQSRNWFLISAVMVMVNSGQTMIQASKQGLEVAKRGGAEVARARVQHREAEKRRRDELRRKDRKGRRGPSHQASYSSSVRESCDSHICESVQERRLSRSE
jgi:hypothetical protein